MSYINSVYSNLQSLQNYSNGVGVTSDNLSHINTPGYKESEYSFSDLVNGRVGETFQVINESQGDIEFTGRNLQAAIDGRGYFLLKGEDGVLYATRNGQFGLSGKGKLVLNGTDLSVQLNNGALNVFEHDFYPARVTSEILISGNIDSSTEIGEEYSPSSKSVVIYDKLGNEYTLKVSFRRDSISKWTMLVSDGSDNPIANYSGIEFDSSGKLVNSKINYELPFSPYSITDEAKFNYQNQNVSDLGSLAMEVSLVEGPGYFLVEGNGPIKRLEKISINIDDDGYFVDSDGNKILFAEDNSLTIRKSDSYVKKNAIPTENIYLGGALDSEAAVGDVYTLSDTSQVIIDSKGNSRPFTVEFRKTNVDEWSLLLKGTDGESITSIRKVTFLSDGSLSPFSRTFSFDLLGKSIRVSMNSENHTPLTHGEDYSALVQNVDGEEQSELKNVIVSEDGELIFEYANNDIVTGPKFAIANNDSTEEINVNLVSYSEGEHALQLGNTSDASTLRIEQNGKSLGERQDITFNVNGDVIVHYNNGESKTVGNLVVADIDRLESADRLGEAFVINDIEYEVISQESESYRILDGAMEGSNVDVTTEFSELMIYQRGYQASSQAMTVAGEMIDELLKGLGR